MDCVQSVVCVDCVQSVCCVYGLCTVCCMYGLCRLCIVLCIWIVYSLCVVCCRNAAPRHASSKVGPAMHCERVHVQVCKRGDASVCVSACVCLFVGRWGGAFVVCVCV